MYLKGFDWLNSFHPFSSNSMPVLMRQSQIHCLITIKNLNLFSSMANSHIIILYHHYYPFLTNNPLTPTNQAFIHPKTRAICYYRPLHVTNPISHSTWPFSTAFIMQYLLRTWSIWYQIALECSLNTFFLLT